MRIRSQFKDYYDGVARNGQDASLLYVRDERVFDVPFDEFLRNGNVYRGYNSSTLENWWVVGFCGQVWLYHCRYSENYGTGNSYFFSSFDREETIKYYRKPQTDGKRRLWPDWGIKTIVEAYNKFDANKSRYQEYFHTFDCPAFIICPKDRERKSILCTNPQLQSIFGFIQKFPPYQAYQELQMWLANKASPEKPIPAIADEIMIEAKGFDKRYSFRKDKQQ